MASEVHLISYMSHHVTLSLGCVKGMMTGVVGVITKPASGILRFTASMASGIGENIMEMGDRVTFFAVISLKFIRVLYRWIVSNVCVFGLREISASVLGKMLPRRSCSSGRKH